MQGEWNTWYSKISITFVHTTTAPVRRLMLGYLRDSNAAAHSFYNECKVVSYRDEFVLVCINFMHDDTLMATCDKGS